MDQSEIGLYIKRKRFERGLTQQDIADHLNVSVKSVSRWENGVNMPSMTAFFYICDFLHVTPEEFFSYETPNPLKTRDTYDLFCQLNDRQHDLVQSLIIEITRKR